MKEVHKIAQQTKLDIVLALKTLCCLGQKEFDKYMNIKINITKNKKEAQDERNK